MIEVGMKAPEFTLENAFGEKVSLSDFLGKKVVLYFYSKDNTSGCTKQAVAFEELRKDYIAAYYGMYFAEIAEYYTKVAKDTCKLPREAGPFVWLDINSAAGEEYWHCMTLAGEYSAVNHQIIHENVAKALRLKPVINVSNHHNFAWKEALSNGREVIIHRKGATPAHLGELGIIPGSMATPGYIVRGLGCEQSLYSASHGAGRSMSRQDAKNTFSRHALKKYLAAQNVELIGGSTEEAPLAYKNIDVVMSAQKELVDIEAKIIPRIVIMSEN